MKNYRQTGGRRLGRGQGGYLGQRAADSVSEESAREHLPDTEGAAPPTSRPSQLPSILPQSLKSTSSALPPPRLPPQPSNPPSTQQAKGSFQTQPDLAPPRGPRDPVLWGPRRVSQGLQAMQVHLLASAIFLPFSGMVFSSDASPLLTLLWPPLRCPLLQEALPEVPHQRLGGPSGLPYPNLAH